MSAAQRADLAAQLAAALADIARARALLTTPPAQEQNR